MTAPIREAVRRLRSGARISRTRVTGRGSIGAPDETPARVETMLEAAGIPIERWEVPADGFRRYLEVADYPSSYLGGPHGGNRFFGQKALEHYVSIELADLAPDDVLVDVASNGGPFIAIARRLVGVTAYESDLQFEPGVHGDRIGGDAADMPVPDGFADVLTLHCSFDHFEGDSDTGFVTEAARVLRPEGRVVILPLYLTERYGAKIDPRLRLPALRLDAGMHPFLMPGLEVRFSRLYDARRLRERVLGPAESAGLEPHVLRVVGGSDVVDGSYLSFALLLRKPAA